VTGQRITGGLPKERASAACQRAAGLRLCRGRVYGAEAAARAYFAAPAADLSREQAAALAAVIINPRRYTPMAPSRRIRNRIALILERMQRYQYYKE
jgi:membrane carboxypeptidase/penicillin-binding protein